MPTRSTGGAKTIAALRRPIGAMTLPDKSYREGELAGGAVQPLHQPW